jgi:hypothetical protein
MWSRTLSTRIDEVAKSLSARIDETNKRIDEVNKRIDDLQKPICAGLTRRIRGLMTWLGGWMSWLRGLTRSRHPSGDPEATAGVRQDAAIGSLREYADL